MSKEQAYDSGTHGTFGVAAGPGQLSRPAGGFMRLTAVAALLVSLGAMNACTTAREDAGALLIE